jgi:ABC transporter DrrB family efflux protein
VAVTVGLAAGSAEATGGLLNLPLTTLSFLSTGFVPADDLPGWAQPIARVNPISVAVEALRALAQGGPTTGPVLRSLAWSAAIAVVFCILALRTLHRRRAR